MSINQNISIVQERYIQKLKRYKRSYKDELFAYKYANLCLLFSVGGFIANGGLVLGLVVLIVIGVPANFFFKKLLQRYRIKYQAIQNVILPLLEA